MKRIFFVRHGVIDCVNLGLSAEGWALATGPSRLPRR